MDAKATKPTICVDPTSTVDLAQQDKSDSQTRLLSDAGQKRQSSFPSRQRRMGPAPLASFEDVSMDKTSDSSPEDRTIMPEITEESGCSTPATPTIKLTELTVPPSPSIRVSAASSSSPHDSDSEESTPDRELFTGYDKSSFCENNTVELHSSTEELEQDEKEKVRRRKERMERMAHFDKKEEALRIAELNRKGSSSSVLSEGLLPMMSGHSSRLSSLGSIGSIIRRSPSPHKMLMETSFCGSKPIQQLSIDLEDPPVSTAKLMNITIERIECVRSPLEARPPDIFRTSPLPFSMRTSTGTKTHVGGDQVSHETESISSFQTTAEISHESVHSVIYSYPQDYDMSTEHISNIRPTARSTSPRSPRLGKKVSSPQVPELKGIKRASPAAYSMTSDHHVIHSATGASNASPKASKKIIRGKDDAESGASSPSTSRKNSFANIFRKTEMLSPVTPESPGSGGRKSPFSQFLKEFRSRSRSRSRSKDRDRDLDDDTHDRRGVFSIFRARSKKKDKTNNTGESKPASTDSKLSETITNVEFTFQTTKETETAAHVKDLDDDQEEVGLMAELRQHFNKTAGKKDESERINISSRDSSYNELSSYIHPEGISKKTVVKELIRHEDEEREFTFEEKRQMVQHVLQKSPLPGQRGLKGEPMLPRNVEHRDESVRPKVSGNEAKNAEIITKHQTASQLSAKEKEHEPDSHSESERTVDLDFYKTKEGKEADDVASPNVEHKELVSQDSFDEELPYVPTTLPQERPLAQPMIPVSKRSVHKLTSTQSIDRPRTSVPAVPARLEDFRPNSNTAETDSDRKAIKITILQSGAVKVLPTIITLKRQSSKTWEDFCQEALRSPGQWRKQYRNYSQQSSEEESQPVKPHTMVSFQTGGKPPQPPPMPSIVTPPMPIVLTHPVPIIVAAPLLPVEPRKWINFEEMPAIVLKPVRQLKGTPSKDQLFNQTQVKITSDSIQPVSSVAQKIQEYSKISKHEDVNLESPPSSKGGSYDHSSDSEDRPSSASSNEELTTVRERLAELKRAEEGYECDDLESLLAPVNECISRLTARPSSAAALPERRSPIPDNWADFLLPPQPGRRSRLSSIGSEAGSMRSPSPCLMETSFCGSLPIEDPSLFEPDLPISVARRLSEISLGELAPLLERNECQPSFKHLAWPDSKSSALSDSSREGSSHDLFDKDGGFNHKTGSDSHLNPFGMDLGVRSNRSSVVSQDSALSGSPPHG